MRQPANNQEKIIHEISNDFVNTTINLMAIVALPFIPINMLRLKETGFHYVIFLLLIICVAMVLFPFIKNRFSLAIRSCFLVSCFFLIGISIISRWGLLGDFSWLVLSVTFATTIFGLRMGIIISLFAILAMIGIAFNNVINPKNIDSFINNYIQAPSSWLLAIIGFMALVIIIISTLGRFHKALINLINNLNNNGTALRQAVIEENKAKQALKENEERLRMALTAAKMGTWQWYHEKNKFYCDDNFYNVLAISPNYPIKSIQDFIQYIYQEDREKFIQSLEKSIKNKTFFEQELRITNNEQGICWIKYQGKPIINTAYTISYMTGIIVDITKTIELQQKVENIKNLLEETQKIGHVGSWDWNIQTNTLFWSEETYRIFRLKPEEFDNSYDSFLSYIHPEDKTKVIQTVNNSLKKNGFYEIEHRVICPDQQQRIVLEKGKVFFDEKQNPVRMIGMVQDISQRKKAEQALEQSKKRFQSLVETINDWVWEIDIEARYTYSSPKIQDLLGYKSYEVLNKLFFSFMPAQEAQRVEEVFIQIVKEKQPFERLEHMVKHKNGQMIILEASGVPIFDDQGHFIGYRGINRDITERKQQEKNIQKAKQYAEAANRSKSVFLANMSHELRTPLNGILGYTHILHHADNFSTKQKQALNTIYQSGQYLLTLISDILDISKIEAQKLELYTHPIHSRNFLQSIISIMQNRAQQKGLQFNYSIDEKLPIALIADEKRLRQILLNLLSNAIKFTHKGDINFIVSILQITESHAKIYFEVQDTGVGISKENLQKIFLPFEQVNQYRYQALEGTGLGLAISYQLVALMGGTLEVKSTVTKGSCFWFDIELAISDQVISSCGIQQNKIIGYSGTQRSLLIVDDNKMNQDMLASLLEPIGFNILLASSGYEALEKLKIIKPDILLLDIIMPDLDGFQTLDKIKNELNIKDIPTIAISASLITAQQIQQAKIEAVLSKPIDIKKLLDILQNILHLNWIYQKNTNTQTIYAPPAAKLKTLKELIILGKMRKIECWAEELSQENPEYKAFAEKVIELAKTINEARLLELIKKYF